MCDVAHDSKGVDYMKMKHLRPFNQEADEPRTGWDADAIRDALEEDKQLFVDDEHGEIWTGGQTDYIGRIIRKEASAL